MARISKKKPIVVLKVGRSDVGAKAANSHTGSLAGSDAVYSAAFKQYGIIRTYSFEELIDTLQAFDAFPLPKDNNVFILSQAGGFGIYCTDALLDEEVLSMPVVEEETKAELRSILPDMASVCIPEGYADITASANVRQHIESLRIVLKDKNVGSVIFITVIPSFLPSKELAAELVKLLKEGEKVNKPVLICIMSGNYVRESRVILEKNGIRTFDTPSNAVKAVRHMVEYASFLKDAEGRK